MDKYNTIQNPSEGIYKEKGSKFLSFAFSVYSVEEAMSIVESYRKRFYDARHVCYAYSVGTDNPQTRVNDDGEPSGTAGRPIMGQIQSYGLNNILIIVVRYFGGILLGTGGLIVAYKSAAADAIENAQIVEKIVEIPMHLQFDYLVMNDVMKIIKDANLSVMNPVYDLDCCFDILCPKSCYESLKNRLLKVESLVLE